MTCDLTIHVRGRIERTAFERALAFASIQPAAGFAGRNGRCGAAVSVPSGRSLSSTGRLGHAVGRRLRRPHRSDERAGSANLGPRGGRLSSSVLLHFHHACADGSGVFGFIEDLLAGYANACPGTEPIVPRPLEPNRLLGRGDMGVDTRSTLRKNHRHAIRGEKRISFSRRRRSRFRPHRGLRHRSPTHRDRCSRPPIFAPFNPHRSPMRRRNRS